MKHRFTGPFRQSNLTDYEVCPRMFYYAHVRGIEPESVHASMIVGQAVHATIEEIHERNLMEESDIRRAFFNAFTREKESVAHLNGSLRWKADPHDVLEEAGTYLTAYASKSWNREATILYAEKKWHCRIGKYDFEGRIDQVRLQDGKIILVDFKSSSYRPSTAFLQRSYQLSLYAYALWKVFDRMPDEIWYYQLKDHLPYRRSGSWGKAGTEKGPAIYRTSRTEAELQYLETDVSRICAAIRFGLYFRRPANLGSCNGFCQYTEACRGEMTATTLSPSTITTIEEVINEQVA